MPYINIAPLLADAHQNHYAIPAFNILNEMTAKAIVQASADLRAPLILQTSVSTVKQIGPQRLIGFLKNLADLYPFKPSRILFASLGVVNLFNKPIETGKFLNLNFALS